MEKYLSEIGEIMKRFLRAIFSKNHQVEEVTILDFFDFMIWST